MEVAICALLAFGSWGVLACEVAERRYKVRFSYGWYAPLITIVALWLMAMVRLAFGVHSLSDTLIIDGIGLPLLSACAYGLANTCWLEARRR